jgi:hypothetical protein
VIRPKLSLRRSLAVLGAAFIGLTGAVAVAGPASAHYPLVKGSVVCAPSGEKVITWVVTHSETNRDATITKIEAKPDAPVLGKDNKSIVGTVLSPKGKAGDTFTGTETLSGDTTGAATLHVWVLWESDGYKGDVTSDPVKLGEPCKQAPPPCVSAQDAHYKHTFDGTKGVATVELVGDKPLCAGVEQPFTLVSYFAPKPQFDVPQYVFGKPSSDTVSSDKPQVNLQVPLPDCNTQVDLIWGGTGEVIKEITADGPRYGDKKLGSPGAPGNRSTGPQGSYNGGSKDCTTPAADFSPACDGSVAVALSNNGELGKYAVEFTITGSGGWSKTVKVEPGKPGLSVSVPAEAAKNIVVKANGMADKSYAWSWANAKCAPPAVAVKPECEKLTVTVTNPKGNAPIDAKVAYGDKTKDVTVAGGSSVPVTFDRVPDLTATVTFAGLDTKPVKVAWDKLANCGGGGAGSLPLTGVAVGSIAGGAAVLLAIGATLFLIARRRRIRFTA